jgi:spore coat-associated protein N
MQGLSGTRKALLSVMAVGTAAAIAGLGTFATFTDTTSASQSVTAGTVDINLPAAGASNRLATGATGLVPGDSLQRAVNLVNAGNQDLASVTLTTSASPSSLLDTDATDGLQVAIDKCSVAWTESGPPYTYTCSGTTSSVLVSRAVIGSTIALSNLGALTAGATDMLRVTLTLPASAPNSMQGLSSTISYTFNATQRVATAK